MSSIGPQIPGDLLWKREEGREEEDKYEDEEGDIESEEAYYADAYGPELPPDLIRQPASTTTHTHDIDSDTQGDEIGPRPVETEADGDDDDDPVRAFMERERRRMKAREEKEAGAGGQRLQREEWMLVPPSSSSVLASIEQQPGKIKARQFSRTNAGTKTRVDNSLWTETPAEKQARIREEVEGKRKRATDVDVGEGESEVEVRESKRSKETEEMVESYNRKRRGGKSLLEMHRSREEEKKRGKEKEKDGEEVIWDRERDMSVGGRLMDDRQRSRMIQDARGLSSRFSRGLAGRFL